MEGTPRVIASLERALKESNDLTGHLKHHVAALVSEVSDLKHHVAALASEVSDLKLETYHADRQRKDMEAAMFSVLADEAARIKERDAANTRAAATMKERDAAMKQRDAALVAAAAAAAAEAEANTERDAAAAAEAEALATTAAVQSRLKFEEMGPCETCERHRKAFGLDCEDLGIAAMPDAI